MQALSQLSYDPTWRRRTLPDGVHFVKKMNGLRAPKLLSRPAAKGGSSHIGKSHARSGHRLSCASSILFRSLSAEAAYLAENDHINRVVLRTQYYIAMRASRTLFQFRTAQGAPFRSCKEFVAQDLFKDRSRTAFAENMIGAINDVNSATLA